MNLALTEESLKILQRYKDFHKLNGIDDWRNIQQSIRISPNWISPTSTMAAPVSMQ
jgi:hypothetical protein